MKNFREYITESKTRIYHGDNHKTTKLSPDLMNNGNNQEGIGIYFGSLDVASKYGKNVVYVDIDTNKFVPSKGYVGDELNATKLLSLFKKLHKHDNEPFYYQLTDWGVELPEPEDVDDSLLEDLVGFLKDEEVRNLQITLAEDFGVKVFVKEWNSVFPNIHGTYDKDTKFYAIINTRIKVNKSKE